MTAHQQLVPVNPAGGFTVSEVERVATAIARGGLFGSKDPNAVLTLCLLAQAEGQHPAVVFRDYHIISGKPSKKADAMLRDFITAGGKIEWHQLDDTCADATFTHPAGSARISWDHARVAKAQLGNNAMYKKYPRQMLRSRVISEGVRTVFPGATSGLYVPEEVESFEPAPVNGGTLEPPANETQMEPMGDEPQKVAGITKIKERLRALMTAGDNAPRLEDFNALVHAAAEDLTKIKEANHAWWTGDGEDFEGFRSWIKRRREELSGDGMVSMLIESMKQCETTHALTTWRAANEEVIEALDGAEGRRFELAWNFHESAVQEMEKVHN